MIKTLKTLFSQDRERYSVPRKVQDVIPIRRIWNDGIFLVGNRYAKTFKFTDVNYSVASREEKESMVLTYSELLNSLDSTATTKITINNRGLNRKTFEAEVLMEMANDGMDHYRQEYNDTIMAKATAGSGIVQEKYITISVCKKNIEEAHAYFNRVSAELTAHFAALGSRFTDLDATEKLRVLHDFYRSGEETYFHFDARDMMKKGHDFRDYICPDSIERHKDYLVLGKKFARVIYLKDYAYMKASTAETFSPRHGGSSASTTLSRAPLRRTWNICWIPCRQAPCCLTRSSSSCLIRRPPTEKSCPNF